MMMFEEMGFCGDLNFFSALLNKVKVEVVVPQNQIELDSMVDNNYSDEKIDVDETNFDVHDQFYLLSFYSMMKPYCSWIYQRNIDNRMGDAEIEDADAEL
ncbi:hypothetical protein BC332_00614 [Capsicum chinense]|nr:hypothetical protein BC332_00614 [Capsicum chinense]